MISNDQELIQIILKLKNAEKYINFNSLFYSYMLFGSVVISFRCAFLIGVECFLLRKYILNFAEATRVKWFTTMTSLGMSRDVRCHRLWPYNCFSNSIQFELIDFILIWTSQNLLKIITFLSISKRNELFDHPSYVRKQLDSKISEHFLDT